MATIQEYLDKAKIPYREMSRGRLALVDDINLCINTNDNTYVWFNHGMYGEPLEGSGTIDFVKAYVYGGASMVSKNGKPTENVYNEDGYPNAVYVTKELIEAHIAEVMESKNGVSFLLPQKYWHEVGLEKKSVSINDVKSNISGLNIQEYLDSAGIAYTGAGVGVIRLKDDENIVIFPQTGVYRNVDTNEGGVGLFGFVKHIVAPDIFNRKFVDTEVIGHLIDVLGEDACGVSNPGLYPVPDISRGL